MKLSQSIWLKIMNRKGNGEKNGRLGIILASVLSVAGIGSAFAQMESIVVKNVIGAQKRMNT